MNTPAKTLLALLLMCGTCQAQDSLVKKEKKRIELGLSMATPLFVLFGVSDHNERYTNLTGRYFLAPKHAVKAFAGMAILNEGANDFTQTHFTATNHSTIYPTTQLKTPANFQLGLGYEYIFGRGRLKSAIGMDVLYNNKFENHSFYYLANDSGSTSANPPVNPHRLDTGAYIHNYNYNKLGFNFSYSLRCELSKHWLLTSSFIMSYKIYRREENGYHSTVSDFNLIGLISDVSVFYRF